MESHTLPAKRIHPLLATAAVSLTLVSLAGVAAITGLLPSSHGTVAPAMVPVQPPLPLMNADDKLAAEAPAAAPIVKHIAPKPVVHHAPPAHVLAQAAPQPRSVAQAETPPPPPACNACGRVEAVQAIQNQPQTNGLGIAAGAVLGGLLGYQVGGGHGKQLATVAGAVGGGLAGNEVERRARASTTYSVRVHMEDGSTRTFPYSEAPAWNAGDRVQVVNGNLTARG